ncbi:hypothetical protein BASA81_002205 [Batrachochytrium salamandrivorans]|nr:hypothetical protein BASA81_002205 [Batrachochytrium salamandrivorans]
MTRADRAISPQVFWRANMSLESSSSAPSSSPSLARYASSAGGKYELNEDWEDWDPKSGTSFVVHMIAGSLAGAAEHLVVFPFDTFKTFLQTEGSGGAKELTDLVKQQGQQRLWRGVSTTLLGCIPAHAGYFSIYELGKVQFGVSEDDESHTPLAAAATGAVATLAHDVVMSPMDVLKQRMQLGFHRNLKDCLMQTVRSEGWIALFRSYPTTLAMNIPFQSLSVSANESFKKLKLFPDNSLVGFFASGFVSGGVAGLLTTPLDVIRTRLNTQNLMVEQTAKAKLSMVTRIPVSQVTTQFLKRGVVFRYPQHARLKYTSPLRCPFLGWSTQPATSTFAPVAPIAASKAAVQSSSSRMVFPGPISVAKHIWECEGFRGFFRGAGQRVAVQAPGFAISWTAYETFKGALIDSEMF